MSDVLALLLDDALPPRRLGELLKEARQRSGLRLSAAAYEAGCTARALRSFERGHAAIPTEVALRLTELYGDALNVPERTPLELPMHGNTDDVLDQYTQLVVRLRGAAPGAPLPLRASDLNALSAALGRDENEIEVRIAHLVGCTREEARALHRELLRRKLVVPIAGLAAATALLAAPAMAAETAGTAEPVPVVALTPPPAAQPAPALTATHTTATSEPTATPVEELAPESGGTIGVPSGETYHDIGTAVVMSQGDDAPHAP